MKILIVDNDKKKPIYLSFITLTKDMNMVTRNSQEVHDTNWGTKVVQFGKKVWRHEKARAFWKM